LPLDADVPEALDDLVFAAFDEPGSVSVLDSKDIDPAEPFREEVVLERRPDVPDMRASGRARRIADSDGHVT